MNTRSYQATYSVLIYLPLLKTVLMTEGSRMCRKISFTLILSAIVTLFASQAFAEAKCSPPAGIDEVISRGQLQYAIFGEVHGTVEAPALFGEAVCAAAAEGRPILVGLEFPESSLEAFQAFLRSDGSPEDVDRFLDDSNWRVRANLSSPDGRTSHAIFRLLQRLRALRAAGQQISITTFFRPFLGASESQTPYEKGLAESLMGAESNGRFDLVMVLVGNVHASKVPLNFRTQFEPMAMHLPQDSTMSLNMISAGGEAWNCRPDCEVHPLRAATDQQEPVITIGNAERDGYDGTFNIGIASASPPLQE